jgi:4-amino-4-deoxy-L-arabinose transferase-like glycosyltransferase
MTKNATGSPIKPSVSIPWNDVLVTALLLLIGIFCQWPILTVMFPGLDDSGYLFDGVRLVEQGTLMPLGSGPLAGIVNGLIYLFFPRDHMLLGYVSLVRRIVLLIGILSAAGIAGKALGGKRAGWAAMAIAAFARPLTTALMVTADSLYSALAGLGFAVLVSGWIGEKRAGRRIGTGRWIGIGLLLGLAALTRLDGIIVGSVLIPVLWFLRGRNRPAARDALIFAGGFILPLAVYFLAYGMATGTWDPQIGQRSYLAFEQGHNFLYAGRYEVIPSPSSAELYGTAEENGYSVLRAIARNPTAFFSRLPLTAANAVRMFYDAYSILGGAMLLFLAAGGALALWRQSHRAVLGFALLWCLPLAGYCLASYRQGFFAMLFPVLLAVVVAGAVPVLAQFRSLIRSEQAPLIAVWALVALGMIGGNAAYAGGQFRSWGNARLSESQYRSWLMELAQQVPRGECVIAYDAASAVYSNHDVYGHWQIFYEARNEDTLRTAMDDAGCRFLVVDDDLRALAPSFVVVAESALEGLYISRDGSRIILRRTP